MITYLRFRAAFSYHGLLHTLPLKTRFQPYATYFTLFMISLLTLTNGFQVFLKGNWDMKDFLAAYITLPIFLVLYLGHRAFAGEKRWWKRVEDVDVVTGVQEMDELAEMDEERKPRNWVERVWFWLA